MTDTLAQRRTCILLNQNAGTARGTNIEDLARKIAAPFRERGDEVDVRIRPPRELANETQLLNDTQPFDLIVLCGGDGTLSRCARDLAENRATLGFLPLGTMNLFVRALGLPVDVEEAAHHIAHGVAREIDVGMMNDTLYLHHVSFGLHPKLIRERESMNHSSRIGKMVTGLRAFWMTIRKPPALRIRISDGERVFEKPASSVVISNNPFGSGHIPYADDVRSGRLGLYMCHNFEWSALLRLGADTMLGRLDENVDTESHSAPRFSIEDAGREGKPIRISIDGELEKLILPAVIECRKAFLSVMLPEEAVRPAAEGDKTAA